MEGKLAAAQQEAEEVKEIMVENMKKADERKEKLEDLEERSAQLLNRAHAFKKSTKKVKQKQWRDNLRSKAGLIAVVTVLALVIIIVVAVMLASQSASEASVQSPAVATRPPGHP